MNVPLSRRQLLGLSGSALLAAGLWPGALRADDGPSFRFIAVNDLHYLNQKCGPWFQKAFQQMKAQPGGIDFVLVGGDLVEHATPEQFSGIHDLLKTLSVPYYVVVGNHDYRTQTDRKTYEQLFPNRINYHFAHQGWQFIGIDTSEGQKSQNVKAAQETLNWLDAMLPKLDKKKPTVLFTHFPLAFGVPFLLVNADAVLERFKPFNLQAVYSGHYHGYTEKKLKGVTYTTNKCCSYSRLNHDRSPEKGFFFCKVTEGRLTRQFIEVKP